MQLLVLPNPKRITLEKHFKYINSVSLFQQFYCGSLTPYLRHYSVKAYGLGGSEQRVRLQTEHQDTNHLLLTRRTLV